MKQIAKSVLKGLLIVVLFTGGSVALSTTGVKTVNEASAATYAQVYEYLVNNGYTVIDLCQNGYKYNWVAHTIKDSRYYLTTIYCDSSGNIIGVSDVIF